MKKILFVFLFAVSCITRAQDLTSRFGEVILPEAKDLSIGIDATKLFKNAGFDFTSATQAITGKYFADPKTAYRLGLRIGVNTWSTRNAVEDRIARTSSVTSFPAAKPMKQNSWIKTSMAFGVTAGLEKRRGKSRLQGLYGFEGGIFLGNSKDKFSYGNALNASPLNYVDVDDRDDALTHAVLGPANNIDTMPAIQNVRASHARILERKNGTTFSIGFRGFIGAEFFVIPKLSVGGEFGWGLGYSITGRSEITYESIGQTNIPGPTTTPSVKQTIIDRPGSESFRLDTDNGNIFSGASASLRVNLYF